MYCLRNLGFRDTLSASAVVIHYEEALYQVYARLAFLPLHRSDVFLILRPTVVNMVAVH